MLANVRWIVPKGARKESLILVKAEVSVLGNVRRIVPKGARKDSLIVVKWEVSSSEIELVFNNFKHMTFFFTLLTL